MGVGVVVPLGVIPVKACPSGGGGPGPRRKQRN